MTDAAAMTPAERALWVQAKLDYDHALAIANDVWKGCEQTDGGPERTADALQAATATILIHVKHLRESSHRTAAPSTAAPAAVKRDETRGASQASGAVPPCPQCGGEMWDNRGKKKNPKSADFACKQKNGACVNEKGYKTGVWEEKAKPNGARGAAHARPTEGYDEMPSGIAEDESDSLPF
jgi:hypothetical protein